MSTLISLIKNKKVLAGAALAIVAIWFFSGSEETTEITYQTQPLSTGSVESIVNTSGAISPVVSVEVGTEVSGLIDELMVDFNSEVSKGMIIARINDEDQQTQVDQREADLISAHATLEQSGANVYKSETQLELDRKAYERSKDLHSRQLISDLTLEQSEAAFRIAEANLEVAKAQYTSSEARLTQAEASLQQTKVDLERTVIRSPVDGVVIDRAVDIGQTVSASLSAPTLFTIAQNLSEIQIEAAVDEADIGKIQEGMDVRFSVDAFSEQEFTGTVSQVRKASTITSNVVTYKVIIHAENPRQILFPGMTANIDIVLGTRTDVLRSPNTALRFNPPETANAIYATSSSDSNNGGSSRGGDRTGALLEQLELSDDIKEQVEEVLTKAAEETRELFANRDPGSFRDSSREQAIAIRERTANNLRSILTPEQYEKYEAATSTQNGGRSGRGGGNDAEALTDGAVWILVDDEPVQKNVQVGLADDQYAQIVSQELADGDQVIVRAIRSIE